MASRERASVICVHDAKLLVVRQQDPVSKQIYLFPPGGLIEAGESPLAAAEREALEETGYRVTADPASEHVVDYTFQWANRPLSVRTHFFKAVLLSDEASPASHAGEILGVIWLPVTQAAKEFAYHLALDAAIRQMLC